MKQKNLLSANLILAIISTVFFGSFFAASSVLASHATAVCETNTFKLGTICNWDDSNSWCGGGNASLCQLEPDAATTPPTAVSNGSWNFCNSCSWTLTCNGGFSICGTTCVANKTCLAGQHFDACSNSCIGTVATLQLAYDSAGGTYLTNSATPVLSIGSAGNVGIGTTNPLDIFSIGMGGDSSPLGSEGTGHNNTMSYLTTDDYALVNYGTVKSIISSTTNLWGGTLNGNIFNGTAGAGNVGIGTTSPSTKLEVVGSGTLLGSMILKNASINNQLSITNATAGINSGVLNFSFSNSGSGFNSYNFKGANSRLAFENTNDGATGSFFMSFNTFQFAYNNYNVLGLMQSGRVGSLVPSTNANPTWRNLLDDGSGNAGIGTTTLLAKLTIQGSGADLINLFNNTATEKFTVLNSGNVGIGTTTPGAALHVYSSTNPGIIVGNGTSGYFKLGDATMKKIPDQFFSFNGDGVQGINYLILGADAVDTNSTLSVTANGLKSIYIPRLTGNVGIGTTAPNDTFSIGGTGGSSAPVSSDGTGHNFTMGYVSSPIDQYALVNYGWMMTVLNAATSSNALWGGTIGGNVWNLNSGNVGIGTTAPGNFSTGATNLVVGTGTGDNGISIFSGSTGKGNLYFGDDAINGGASRMGVIQYDNANDNFSIWTSASGNGMTINSSGNVGIGTTGPAQKLDVAGNININTNGTSALFSTYKGTGSDGNNIWIGGGGQSSLGPDWYQGTSNTAIGMNALYYNTTGFQNTATGLQALYRNTSGNNNTADGYKALASNTTGFGNTANGISSLLSNTGGYNNTANGSQALQSNTGGSNNTANGTNALYSNTTGDNNTANGISSLLSNTTGSFNTANGYNSLYSNTTGTNNIAGGYFSLYNNITGSYNIALGYQSGMYTNTYDNTYVFNLRTPTNSLFIGADTKASADGNTNENVIGYRAIGNGSNSVTLGNTSIIKTILNGSVGIGTTAPNDKLSIGMGGLSAPVGSAGTGHNNTMSYAPGDDYALLNYGTFRSSVMNASNTAAVISGGDLNMGGKNILNVNKLTVLTIDPLYNIKGINYSTYASSISGGVKEECLGKVVLNTRNSNNEYEKIIDFSTESEGTNLWVWRQVVDFNFDNIEVLLTPYGKFANTYYLIENNKLIFRSDKPITLSYRLIGNRFDWRKWPTKALDQTEKGTMVNLFN